MKLREVFPILDVEHDCILSKQGDITVVFKVELPEVFTLSDQEYEAFHHTWVKAIKVLPRFTILHKQDWFIDSHYEADFLKPDTSFLSHSSERFFNERPYLDHSCYIMLTKKPPGRKEASSLFTTLTRRNIVPQQTVNRELLQDFLDAGGQFRHIMEASGFVKMERMKGDHLLSHRNRIGLIEKYM